mgnify:CR=1 FL=1
MQSTVKAYLIDCPVIMTESGFVWKLGPKL